MLFQRASKKATAAVHIKATAFRSDRSAELVTITALLFDRCQLSSRASFELGERLRLHLPGQGTVEAAVDWISGDRIGAVFVTECHV